MFIAVLLFHTTRESAFEFDFDVLTMKSMGFDVIASFGEMITSLPHLVLFC